jgi:hypothetical protein
MTNIFLHQLIGTWLIVGSNFPMWVKGDKLSPSFTYTLTQRRGKQVLYDEVSYLEKGKKKVIRGYDHQDPSNEKAFTWRGKGLLFIAKSKWQVKLMDDKDGWAVIWFSKTLFTPEGVDIICRSRPADPEKLMAEIKNKMMQDELLKKYVQSVVILQ